MADQENEQRRRLELAALNAANNKTNEDVAKKNKINQKKQQVRNTNKTLVEECLIALRHTCILTFSFDLQACASL